jgi:signal transduction histidine kinase
MTVGALAEMRTLLFEMRPSALADTRLPILLQQLGDVLTGRQQVPVDLVVRGDVQPPADVKIAFYRIAQEAFNNIGKHAEATHVAVTLAGSANAVDMTIVDNGRGFDPGARLASGGRLGLSIMSERAESVSARLKIDSQPGQGASITLSWEDRVQRK